ncbi:hypothetical protein ASZ90_009206 [hydrocarbon metagenome]|uniref:Uncharacterized protein n=1 Tax=hydrocarbon metagenome TaxID=938273 RepID=A0A0W8FJX4_9ZZZZ
MSGEGGDSGGRPEGSADAPRCGGWDCHPGFIMADGSASAGIRHDALCTIGISSRRAMRMIAGEQPIDAG